jgi:transcription regulator MmyB-like protein
MDRDTAASDGLVGPVLRKMVEHLAAYPAVVFSRRGEVLAQTRPARALIGGHTWLGASSCCRHLYEVGPTGHHLRRYRHAALGELELHRQLLVDVRGYQVLMVFTAASGSLSEKKLRLLAATTG